MPEQPQITTLLRELRDETTTLMREEFALAKKEMTEKLSRTTRNLTYLIAGGLVAYLALALVLLGFSALTSGAFWTRGMDEPKAIFLGLLAVAVVVGIFGAILISKALKTLKQESPIPERTMQTLREDRQWARNQI